MSDDDTSDLLPSGFSASTYSKGDFDFGMPLFPEAVWIAQMGMTDIETGLPAGIAYRLMWGSIDESGESHLDGELWMEPKQVQGILAQYVTMSLNENQEGG